MEKKDFGPRNNSFEFLIKLIFQMPGSVFLQSKRNVAVFFPGSVARWLGTETSRAPRSLLRSSFLGEALRDIPKNGCGGD